jgi:hypothetical protein
MRVLVKRTIPYCAKLFLSILAINITGFRGLHFLQVSSIPEKALTTVDSLP